MVRPGPGRSWTGWRSKLTGGPGPDTHRQSRIHALENQITELAAHIHAATCRLLKLIREYDECGGWASERKKGWRLMDCCGG